jgi:hypothetical protein
MNWNLNQRKDAKMQRRNGSSMLLCGTERGSMSRSAAENQIEFVHAVARQLRTCCGSQTRAPIVSLRLCSFAPLR